MMLWDFQCCICKHTFEELVSNDDPLPKCPVCEQETEMLVFCNKPTKKHNPHMEELKSKGVHLKKRYLGQLPYRKSSYSQSD